METFSKPPHVVAFMPWPHMEGCADHCYLWTADRSDPTGSLGSTEVNFLDYARRVAQSYGVTDLEHPFKVEKECGCWELYNGQVFWKVEANPLKQKAYIECGYIKYLDPSPPEGGTGLRMEYGYSLLVGIQATAVWKNLTQIYWRFGLEEKGCHLPLVPVAYDPHYLNRPWAQGQNGFDVFSLLAYHDHIIPHLRGTWYDKIMTPKIEALRKQVLGGRTNAPPGEIIASACKFTVRLAVNAVRRMQNCLAKSGEPRGSPVTVNDCGKDLEIQQLKVDLDKAQKREQWSHNLLDIKEKEIQDLRKQLAAKDDLIRTQNEEIQLYKGMAAFHENVTGLEDMIKGA